MRRGLVVWRESRRQKRKIMRFERKCMQREAFKIVRIMNWDFLVLLNSVLNELIVGKT